MCFPALDAGFAPLSWLPPESTGAASQFTAKGNFFMSIVWTILIGFIVGLVARAVKPGDDSAGFIVTTLIGVAGSLIVTYVGQAMGWYTAGQGAGFIASVLGAIVLLILYGLIKRKS
jgi:uncharacterized membrane protein YeaQ/YmgE (transglycosylase-associated protein family)